MRTCIFNYQIEQMVDWVLTVCSFEGIWETIFAKWWNDFVLPRLMHESCYSSISPAGLDMAVFTLRSFY